MYVRAMKISQENLGGVGGCREDSPPCPATAFRAYGAGRSMRRIPAGLKTGLDSFARVLQIYQKPRARHPKITWRVQKTDFRMEFAVTPQERRLMRVSCASSARPRFPQALRPGANSWPAQGRGRGTPARSRRCRKPSSNER